MKSLIMLLAGSLLAVGILAAESDFDPGTLDYEISFNGKRMEWRELAFFVMPGQERELTLHLPDGMQAEAVVNGGELRRLGPARWVWTAPDEPGLVRFDIHPGQAQSARLNVIVMVPLAEVENGYLNGYRIGRYPDKPLRGNPIYLPPPGLIEVSPELADLPVSPHFTLGQFLCKQQPDHWPKYLVLREALVAKLEIILAEVNDRGIHTDSFHVMSGYRTPWYNRAIGNGRYSRHVWGGAADIFIDTNGNGRMDDLNGDGRSGVKDARLLLSIIDDLYDSGRHERLHGGLGLYGPRPHRGPFVHVDARGHEARWTVP
ncbi:peptidase M15A [Wenzhouxiangella sp. AB-CW3]|uniref:D-Ala-D-Ala carboxypeptidase family metallohydrolase n=1 Tax=Wenzhouxiangella sp. AB-CW3 TaxID=2771012 RepID=UPI00168B5ED3|nr:D-Ala-D-Ala carboxypeptidase family metallohydrolase [Wenzhouxiangella sp. AB-CW3]QOC22111.1 peptidase M15A [Wenzhouxiangella sp. AB-CW3]